MSIVMAVFIVVVGSLCAFVIGGFVRSALFDAHKHENTSLLFLHVFWIILLTGFATEWPLWLGLSG